MPNETERKKTGSLLIVLLFASKSMSSTPETKPNTIEGKEAGSLSPPVKDDTKVTFATMYVYIPKDKHFTTPRRTAI